MASDDKRAQVGNTVRQLRERRGKSRAATAGLLGKSEDWLKKIERGQRGLPLETGVKLARVLGVKNLAEIYGPEVSAPVTQAEGPSHPAAEEVGHALTGYLPTDDKPVSPQWLQAAAASAWQDWHASEVQRSVSAKVLPELIQAGRNAVQAHEGTDRRQARAALADVMHLGQAYLAWQGDAHHWYWLTVDRGRSLAEDADIPTAYATGLLYSAFALRVTGREEQAVDQLRHAAESLEPHLETGPDDVRGLWGVIQLARASTKARHLGDPSAWVHWEDANRIVSRLPDDYAHHHGFSAGHVALHRTWLAQALGDATEAVRSAEKVDVGAIPSRSWRASHLVHVARALHQQRDSGALIPLMQAERHSSEAVQFNLAAREVIGDLAQRGPMSIRTEAAKFAERLGIAA
ncbi:helix-turn-helix transcriptional regulator [Saccharopolyspora shandongensis]|uniref:helix-turn-helix domain-containing protein n=1 Tax=Saccharopolyspora shandongensis TaxID=418495 RepID=UPI003435EDF1